MGLSFLHIGLPLDHAAVPEKIRGSIGQRLKDLQSTMEAAELKYSYVYCSPETGLDNFVDKLKAERCDGLIMGEGFIINPDLYHFMEQIIDVTHINAPEVKIMFMTTLETVPDVVRRWFAY